MADMESLAMQESVSYKGNLKKKIGKNSWKGFYVLLEGNKLIFSNPNDGRWAGNIELHEGSTVNLHVKGSRIGQEIQDPTINTEIAELNKRKHRGENLKFSLQTKRGVHLLKADSESLCLEWIRELRKAVLIIREENYSKLVSKHFPGKPRRSALDHGKNNKTRKDLCVYQAVEAEDSESEEKINPGRRSRSMSSHEPRYSRESTFNFIKRSRFRSFRKLSRNYENLNETYA
ncbi:uncharacterized protein LOC116305640 [Actinia tenebrosa]|uniref:Uncharacterized protein LOC116305640 n=1 Tax=Actinia tenebrosa TaxID=6105 RepID=A0A6P8J0L4_ACTTE|nr:uncharacterized protein LOC116305640 [Actinia tenebrosa]